MDDDIEVDDILGRGEKKKRLNSGRKGKRVERELVKVLNERFGGGFSRSAGSGNRWGQVAHLPKHAQDTFSGDLVCPEDFAFIFESKGGYDDLDLNSIFDGGSALLDSFLKQATDESERTGRKPVLAWKKNRRPWLAFVRTTDLPHSNWQYRLIYREWSAVPLTELLQEDDSFFFLESP
jgi:Holliday junction resolvase